MWTIIIIIGVLCVLCLPAIFVTAVLGSQTPKYHNAPKFSYEK